MSIDGIWTSEILGPYEWENSGVYILEDGQIVGGNNRHYSFGHFTLTGADYSADVTVHYYGPPRTVFSDNRQEFQIRVTGKLDKDVIEAEITRSDRRGFNVIYRMTKRMHLPER